MSLRLVAVSFDTDDPAGLAVFWAGMLGREVVSEARGALVPGDATQIGLRFVTAAGAEESGQNRLHLHLTSSTVEDQQHTVETALRLGGRHLDVGQLPEGDHVVMTDPDGNPFCVIEPGNSFLAACGVLGEVACDGTRQVGLSRHLSGRHLRSSSAPGSGHSRRYASRVMRSRRPVAAACLRASRGGARRCGGRSS